MKYVLYSIFGERFIGFILGIVLIELVVLAAILLIWMIHELITDFGSRPFNHSHPKR